MVAQETFCSNPPANVNINTPINYTIQSQININFKYYTTSTIRIGGYTIDLISNNNKFFSANSVTWGAGFRAMPTNNQKVISSVGLCTNYSSIQTTDDSNSLLDSNSNILLYPNPTSNNFFVICTNFIVDKIEIYSFEGKLIHKKEFIQNKELSIEIGKFPDGIYDVVVFEKNNNIIYKKIIKKSN
ncbi:hypothetical protein FB1_23810 [Flavobacterium branchiophilum NBRC 15030 = ATCC 35035]|nr:hypothetical protein FB1_23810 [Flavobacterium branchiophilum NBRC 15030 = ATCC 35035]